MFNNAIRSIIDLLKLRKDVKKTDLEIEKLEREQKIAESMIKLASFEDIEKFDPKAKKLINMLPYKAARKRSNYRRIVILLIALLIIIFVIIAATYKFFA